MIIVGMAGLQFNSIGFDQTRKYVAIFMHWSYWIQTSQTGDQPYSDYFTTLIVLSFYVGTFNSKTDPLWISSYF